MAITKEQKKEILADLVDKFGRSKAVVFSDYRGLDVASVSDLRNRLREKGAEAKVAKKTLIKLAAEENNIEGLSDDMLEGPVSATFSYEDELSGLQVLFKFSKENDNLKLLGGIVDGKPVDADTIKQLAQLPSKEELIAKLMGSINAPVSNAVGLLGNLIGSFVRVMNAYKDTLPEEAAPAAPAAEEAPKEEVPAEEKAEETPAETTEEAAPAEETAETPAEEAPAEAEAPAEGEGEEGEKTE